VINTTGLLILYPPLVRPCWPNVSGIAIT